MTLRFRTRVDIPDSPVFRGQAGQVMQEELARTMRSAVLFLEGEVAKRTPVGVSGRLRAAWGSQVSVVSQRRVQLRGTVANPLPYALVVEEGRPAGAPLPPSGPGSDLARWVRIKLGPQVRAYVVARAIARRGIPGRRFVDQALQIARQPINAFFAQARDRIARRLRGD